jgi:acetyl-CoA synthetase
MQRTYEQLYDEFQWSIPEFFNIGVEVCDRHAKGNTRQLALIFADESGKVEKYTFGDLMNTSNRFANMLQAMGIIKGDRFGILLSQRPETLIAHLAGFKLGLINIPLFTLFGPDALKYRLSNSEARAIIVDSDNIQKVLEILPELPHLQTIICVDKPKDISPNIIDYNSELVKASDRFKPVITKADDPAIIIYTSGTTGPPKGALHAHRVLLGHLPGVELPHNFFPQPEDCFWTPADWAWIGGLFDVLFPSLYHGVPVVAFRAKKFDPERALDLIAKQEIRNVFFPPTALKLLRSIRGVKEKYNINLRTIASGGEPLGEEILYWGRSELNLEINEFYGQTEANLLVGNCTTIMPVKPGSMGRAIPGHQVAVIDENGNPLPPGQVGEIAVKKYDPVLFLGYWQNDKATKDKFIKDWMITGDTGYLDEDGYFWFGGRKDDVITSAGYRIGPSEIEDCLLKHPAVAMSAVVGSPDKVRGEIVKAFIVLNEAYQASPELMSEIQLFVKNRLAAHEYPREIEFIDKLPMTITGKVKRGDLKKLEIERKQKG